MGYIEFCECCRYPKLVRGVIVCPKSERVKSHKYVPWSDRKRKSRTTRYSGYSKNKEWASPWQKGGL